MASAFLITLSAILSAGNAETLQASQLIRRSQPVALDVGGITEASDDDANGLDKDPSAVAMEIDSDGRPHTVGAGLRPKAGDAILARTAKAVSLAQSTHRRLIMQVAKAARRRRRRRVAKAAPKATAAPVTTAAPVATAMPQNECKPKQCEQCTDCVIQQASSGSCKMVRDKGLKCVRPQERDEDETDRPCKRALEQCETGVGCLKKMWCNSPCACLDWKQEACCKNHDPSKCKYVKNHDQSKCKPWARKLKARVAAAGGGSNDMLETNSSGRSWAQLLQVRTSSHSTGTLDSSLQDKCSN